MKIQTETIIDKLEAHIVAECETVDVEAAFKAMLDECYSFAKVGGPFAYLSPSRVLEELCPTDFRCGVADYSDSLETTEIRGDEYNNREVDKAKEEFIDALRDELTELEAELDEQNEDGSEDLEAFKQLAAEIAEKKSEIDECEKHSF